MKREHGEWIKETEERVNRQWESEEEAWGALPLAGNEFGANLREERRMKTQIPLNYNIMYFNVKEKELWENCMKS